MNKNKYFLVYEQDCDDQFEYDAQMDFIKENDALMFTGNRDFNDIKPSWYKKIENLYEDVKGTIDSYISFGSILRDCTDLAEHYTSNYLKDFGITLTASDILSIFDYYQELLIGENHLREAVKSKLDYKIIDYKYGYDFGDSGEVLDIANYLFKGNLRGHDLTGYCQGDYWYCFSIENNDNIYSDFDYDFISRVIFGGLIEYVLIEIDTPDIDKIDIEELGNNIDYEQNEWWIDRHKTLEELKAGTGYNIIKKIRVEKQPRTVYTKTFNLA